MTTPAPGTPVYSPNGEAGFIVGAAPAPENKIFAIGAGGLRPVVHDFEVCFAGRLATLSDNIVAPWIERARRMELPAVPAEEIQARRAAALQAQADARADAQARQRQAEERAAAFKIEAAARMPAGAKAVIVAELVEDRSDTMTDYFGSTTVRTVILGFSSHTRDLFPELRKAAAAFAETADLATAPASAEHREKYSMGAGYYLKTGSRNSNGWKVSKSRLYRGADSIPVGEWAADLVTPAAPAGPVTVSPGPAAGLRIEEHTHTKGGFRMWVVVLGERVEREDFDRMRGEAQILGGWYSRKWGATPAGFAFKSEDKAKAFADQQAAPVSSAAVQVENAPARRASSAAGAGAGTADKLRAMADRLQVEIDQKFAPRLANTPKRQREAASARLDGAQLQRAQQAMRALADLHASGNVPAALQGVTTKAALVELARARIKHSGGYYDAGSDTGEPAKDTPAALALWALLKPASAADQQAGKVRDLVEAVRFVKIEGYFPTPAAVVAQMIEAADIPDGGCSVLEPSAGHGAILDAVAAAAPGCSFVAYECNSRLREILTAKGYTLAGHDFTESDTSQKVARVLMNPPFERGQDADHVRRAFSHLEEGGRLVAIMSPGAFYRTDAKSRAFREWFDDLGGEKTALPVGAFKESGTCVATVLVTIRA